MSDDNHELNNTTNIYDQTLDGLSILQSDDSKIENLKYCDENDKIEKLMKSFETLNKRLAEVNDANQYLENISTVLKEEIFFDLSSIAIILRKKIDQITSEIIEKVEPYQENLKIKQENIQSKIKMIKNDLSLKIDRARNETYKSNLIENLLKWGEEKRLEIEKDVANELKYHLYPRFSYKIPLKKLYDFVEAISYDFHEINDHEIDMSLQNFEDYFGRLIKQDIGEIVDCVVTSTLSEHGIFWIQLYNRENIHQISNIIDEISKHIRIKRLTDSSWATFEELKHKPYIGEHCFCLENKTRKWLRARIDNNVDDKLDIRYLDTGLEEKQVHAENLLCWKEFKLNRIQFQALQCTLNVETEKSIQNETVTYFKNLVHGKKFKCILQDKVVDTCHSVANSVLWQVNLYSKGHNGDDTSYLKTINTIVFEKNEEYSLKNLKNNISECDAGDNELKLDSNNNKISDDTIDDIIIHSDSGDNSKVLSEEMKSVLSKNLISSESHGNDRINNDQNSLKINNSLSFDSHNYENLKFRRDLRNTETNDPFSRPTERKIGRYDYKQIKRSKSADHGFDTVNELQLDSIPRKYRNPDSKELSKELRLKSEIRNVSEIKYILPRKSQSEFIDTRNESSESETNTENKIESSLHQHNILSLKPESSLVRINPNEQQLCIAQSNEHIQQYESLSSKSKSELDDIRNESSEGIVKIVNKSETDGVYEINKLSDKPEFSTVGTSSNEPLLFTDDLYTNTIPQYDRLRRNSRCEIASTEPLVEIERKVDINCNSNSDLHQLNSLSRTPKSSIVGTSSNEKKQLTDELNENIQQSNSLQSKLQFEHADIINESSNAIDEIVKEIETNNSSDGHQYNSLSQKSVSGLATIPSQPILGDVIKKTSLIQHFESLSRKAMSSLGARNFSEQKALREREPITIEKEKENKNDVNNFTESHKSLLNKPELAMIPSNNESNELDEEKESVLELNKSKDAHQHDANNKTVSDVLTESNNKSHESDDKHLLTEKGNLVETNCSKDLTNEPYESITHTSPSGIVIHKFTGTREPNLEIVPRSEILTEIIIPESVTPHAITTEIVNNTNTQAIIQPQMPLLKDNILQKLFLKPETGVVNNNNNNDQQQNQHTSSQIPKKIAPQKQNDNQNTCKNDYGEQKYNKRNDDNDDGNNGNPNYNRK